MDVAAKVAEGIADGEEEEVMLGAVMTGGANGPVCTGPGPEIIAWIGRGKMKRREKRDERDEREGILAELFCGRCGLEGFFFCFLDRL